MNFWTLIKSVYIEAPVVDETLWHKRLSAPLFAKIEGANPSGQIWRRKRNGKWEYQQEPETDEEYYARVI